jgi:hypothetical protein
MVWQVSEEGIDLGVDARLLKEIPATLNLEGTRKKGEKVTLVLHKGVLDRLSRVFPYALPRLGVTVGDR